MSTTLLSLAEARAILQTLGAPAALLERFAARALEITERKPHTHVETDDDGNDHVAVGSGYGTQSKRGFVEFILNTQATQMTPRKAREIGLMLIEAAEAATSDEIFMRLIDQNVPDMPDDQRGGLLLELREIRQGSKGTVHAS